MNLNRFNNNLGGWIDVEGRTYVTSKRVEVIDKNQYILELENTNKVTIFVNGGILYYGDPHQDHLIKLEERFRRKGSRSKRVFDAENSITVNCEFLGNFIAKGIVSMLKIKTGWFSSIQVSHDALVCLDDLNIPLNSSSDWEKALASKQEVRNYKKKLDGTIFSTSALQSFEQEKLKQEELKQEKIKQEKIKQEKTKQADANFEAGMAKARYAEAEAAKKARLSKTIHSIEKYGQTDGSKINDKKIWQGMTKEMLIASRGRPADIDETVYKTKTKAAYFYEPYRTKQGNTRYKFRVSLENSIVVGWKDLD